MVMNINKDVQGEECIYEKFLIVLIFFSSYTDSEETETLQSKPSHPCGGEEMAAAHSDQVRGRARFSLSVSSCLASVFPLLGTTKWQKKKRTIHILQG